VEEHHENHLLKLNRGVHPTSGQNERGESLLAVAIEPELGKRIEAAAAARGMSLRASVASELREALNHGHDEGAREWSRLSVPAFARDWDSDADAIYDDLPEPNRSLREALGL
jgi:hypothetical protein